MYSIFLPFACLILDILTAYVYLKNDFWISGLMTALLALVPLTLMATLVFCQCIKIKKATILIGFLHSGPQVILQVILLFKYWNNFEGLLISYGTLDSPQYTMIVISILCGALVMAKSSRECHFICQAPKHPLRITASYFRASPFFLLHIAYRAVAIGLNCAVLPVWLALLVILIHYIANFIQIHFIVGESRRNTALSAFTTYLSPVVFPGSEVVSFGTLKKLEVINSSSSAGLILLTAILVHFVYVAPLCQQSTDSAMMMSEMICWDHWTLNYGFIPWIALASVVYIGLIVLIVVVVSPKWLQLPDLPELENFLQESSYDSAYSSSELERVSIPSFNKFQEAKQSDV